MKAFAGNGNGVSIIDPIDAIVYRVEHNYRRLLFLALAVSECHHILTPLLYSIAHPTTLWPEAQTCFFAFAHFRAEYSASCAIPDGHKYGVSTTRITGYLVLHHPRWTKTFEKKKSRWTRKRGRREKERRGGIDPWRKGPRQCGAVIFSSSGNVTGISLVIKSHRAVWLELMVKWSICPEGKKAQL